MRSELLSLIGVAQLLAICVQVDLILHQPCSDDATNSHNIGGFVQLIKFSKSSKLFNLARTLRLVRLGKVLNLLRKIENRFVTVQFTAFKIMSIVGFTFIMAHLFGCMFIFFAALDDANYYTNSWVFSSGQFTQNRGSFFSALATPLYLCER